MQAFFDFLFAFFDSLIPVGLVDPWEEGIRVRLGRWVKQVGPGPVFLIPFVDALHTINTRRQVVDLNNDSVETADRIPMLVSITITYKIRNAAKTWLEVQDHDESIIADAMTIVAAWVNKTNYEDLTVEALISACEPEIRKSGFRWGCEVEWIGVMDLAKHRILRLLME